MDDGIYERPGQEQAYSCQKLTAVVSVVVASAADNDDDESGGVGNGKLCPPERAASPPLPPPKPSGQHELVVAHHGYTAQWVLFPLQKRFLYSQR